MRTFAIGTILLALLMPLATALPAPVDPEHPIGSAARVACRLAPASGIPDGTIGDLPVSDPYLADQLDAMDGDLQHIREYCYSNAASLGDFGIGIGGG